MVWVSCQGLSEGGSVFPPWGRKLGRGHEVWVRVRV
jgi:hypothetical protein